jgi:hypothetical protein
MRSLQSTRDHNHTADHIELRITADHVIETWA